jgi:hypothetical protein
MNTGMQLTGLPQDALDIGGAAGGLGDDLGKVVSQPVVGHTPLNRHPQTGDLREANRVVGLRRDGRAQVQADLVGVDVEGGDELDIADMIAAQPRAHEARDEAVVGHTLVVVDTLHQSGCAVTDSDHRNANRSHGRLLSASSPRHAETRTTQRV